MTQTYQYDPIDAKDEFRLILLKAGAGSDPLSGDILTASFGGDAKYVALSYVWGADNKCKQLNTQNGLLPITESLESALISLRTPDTDVLLWADAICINQAENQEKNHQVRRMRDIYAGAEMVRAHLGDESDNSELAYDLIRTLNETDIAAAYNIDPDSASLQRLVFMLRDAEDDGLLPPKEHPAWEAVRALLRRPWFRRVWIVQEFTVAKDVVFSCGSWSMSWLTLAGAISQCQRLQIRELWTGPISNEMVETTKQGQSSIFALIWLRDTLATRARDHLFSMLGLARDADDGAFDPDYDDTLVRVVCRYGAALVRLGHGSKLLAMAGIIPGVATSFPSWLPDWTASRLWVGVLCAEDPAIRVYSAGGEGNELKMRVTTNQNKLEMPGQFFDVIVTVGTSCAEHPNAVYPADLVRVVINRLNEAEALVGKLPAYPTGEPVETAFWTTMISDSREFNTRGSKAFANEYGRAKEVLQMLLYDDDAGPSVIEEKYTTARDYVQRMFVAYDPMRFCITEKGYMGLCPNGTRAGDVCYILHGMQTPYIMRRTAGHDSEQLRLVGQCYIHGIMDGEACSLPAHTPRDIQIW